MIPDLSTPGLDTPIKILIILLWRHYLLWPVFWNLLDLILARRDLTGATGENRVHCERECGTHFNCVLLRLESNATNVGICAIKSGIFAINFQFQKFVKFNSPFN